MIKIVFYMGCWQSNFESLINQKSMKTMKTKITTGAMFILLLASMAISKQSHAQFIGLFAYFNEDSIPGANICLSETIDGSISWNNNGIYLPGDNLDVNVDWGDGNTSPYLNIPIQSGGSNGYVSPFYVGHNYSTVGSYTVIVTSMDNYGFSSADTFQFNMSNLCGTVMTTAYLDDGDGVFDWQDLPMPGVDLNLTSGMVNYFSTTDAFGYGVMSNVDVNQPSYTLEVDPSWLSSTGMTTIAPISGNYSVSGLGSLPQQYQFLLDCGVSTYYDAAIWGTGWGFRAGLSDGYAAISITNASCNGSPATTDISLDFDPMLTVFSSTLPGGVITPGNISWTGVSVPFGQFNFRVYFTVPGGTPALTPLAFQADVTSTSATDVNPINNTYTFNSEVRNSWDPNDKSTNVPHLIDVNTQDEIVYTIRFQNMGNDDAYHISIKDTISTLLNLSSFRVVSQSHAGSYSINPSTREVIFSFPNIYLVPQSVDDQLSQGYIMYSIDENPGLALNSEIENTAHIFFDQNAAVVTNTTSNINVMNPSGIDESPLGSMVIYPSPADHFIFMNGIELETITAVKIFDLNGKVVEVLNNAANMYPISVKHIPNGLYLLQVDAGENSITKKICVQH